MLEHADKPMSQITYCYIGDCRFNTADTLMIGGCQLGMDVRLCAPRSLWLDPALVDGPVDRRRHRARLTLTEDKAEAVKGVDYIHADVWVSMGEPDSVWAERIDQLMPYQVNRELLELSGNPAVKFMHCLPAFHSRETEVGEEVFEKFGIDGHGGDRRGLRVEGVDRVRPGREPDAHHQGHPGGDADLGTRAAHGGGVRSGAAFPVPEVRGAEGGSHARRGGTRRQRPAEAAASR